MPKTQVLKEKKVDNFYFKFTGKKPLCFTGHVSRQQKRRAHLKESIELITAYQRVATNYLQRMLKSC